MSAYIALIHKDDDSDYGVSFPDFPGCVTAGSTLDEARAMASEALAFHIDGMKEDGDPIPEPSDLATVMQERENQDAVAFLVDVGTRPSKTVRVNITLPEAALNEIDAAAERDGYTRSGFLLKAARMLTDSKASQVLVEFHINLLERKISHARTNLEWSFNENDDLTLKSSVKMDEKQLDHLTEQARFRLTLERQMQQQRAFDYSFANRRPHFGPGQ